LVATPQVLAQCSIELARVCSTSGIQTINYIPLGNEPFGNTLDATDKWAFGCFGQGYTSGYDFPSMNVSNAWSSDGTTLNVYIFYVASSSQSTNGSCGETDVMVDGSGQITGASITMYQTDIHGNSCNAREWVAHEMGHTLGLADVDGNPACNGTMMGYPPADISQWAPSSDQCRDVSGDWFTPMEFYTQQSCEQYCRGTCDETGQCTDQEPSPIVIDIGGHGYHLTSLQEGVRFDLNGDGQTERTSWTRDSGNGFLCLDRNHDGLIGSGRELFGNYTLLPDGSEAFNGYQALAVYDQPDLGGNGDGWIGPGDAIWPYLRVWIDTNHDGVSQARETSTMDDLAIVRIDTRYFLSKRRDPYGNLFRYRGRCVIRDRRGAEHDRAAFDVFLVSEP
jgi:hypothetical protein